MNRLLPLAAAALVTLACSGTVPPAPVPAAPQALERIAFGACADQKREQPIWDTILAAQPDLMLLLGDNVYSTATNREELRAEYAQLAAVPGFARLRVEVPIRAIWDDHDFGVNDGGADNPRKDLYAEELLAFFDDPPDSPRRHRPGLYHAEVFGPPGRRVQVILLDTRYFRSPLVPHPEGESIEHGRYVPNTDPAATLLGEAQWRWLAEELRRPAELRIIGSSIQVIPNEHGWEKWGQLPHERRRLFGLIREIGARGVVLLSGDRHLAEISRLPADDPLGVGYPLYEVTTGGLTHSTGLPFEPNPYRVAGERSFRGENFGVVAVDWNGDGTRVRLEIHDLGGEVVRSQSFMLRELAP